MIFSHCRQVNFSRTVWITFHCRGMTSSVSLTSSPIFTIRAEPQQEQTVGASITTRSRSRCSGNGLRARRRRSNPATVVVFANLIAAIASSMAAATSSSSCSSIWSIQRARRSELQPYCSRWSLAISSRRCEIIASEVEPPPGPAPVRSRRPRHGPPRPRARRAIWQSRTRHPTWPRPTTRPLKAMKIRLMRPDYPAFTGRCVQRGLRQSIPSRRYPSWAAEMCTASPLPLAGQMNFPASRRLV